MQYEKQLILNIAKCDLAIKIFCHKARVQSVLNLNLERRVLAVVHKGTVSESITVYSAKEKLK